MNPTVPRIKSRETAQTAAFPQKLFLLALAGFAWLLCVTQAIGSAPLAPASTWTDEKLVAYLQSANRSEAMLIRELSVRQSRRVLALYDQTGVEEVHRRLHRRPILALASPEGPFVRETQFVARVDRSQGIEVIARLERITRSASGVQRTPVEKIRVRLHPSPEAPRWITGEEGMFTVTIPQPSHSGGVDLECFDGSERHVLALVFFNHKAPVTLEPVTESQH